MSYCEYSLSYLSLVQSKSIAAIRDDNMSLEGGRVWQSIKIYMLEYAGVDADMIMYAIKSECHDTIH